MRLIDADVLKTKKVRSKERHEWVVPVAEIDWMPTIEEHKTGYWLRTGRDNVFGGFEVECSECGDTVMIAHIEDELYCRHCGAKMGEGEHDADVGT